MTTTTTEGSGEASMQAKGPLTEQPSRERSRGTGTGPTDGRSVKASVRASVGTSAKAGRHPPAVPDHVTYPHSGRRYAFKTIRCKLDQDDVATAWPGINELFSQYSAAVRFFLRLMPVRAPFRKAFRKEDMAAAKAATPGLVPGLRSTALDKAIEMWRSFEAKRGPSRRGCTGMPWSSREHGKVESGQVQIGARGRAMDMDVDKEPPSVRLSRKDLGLELVAASMVEGKCEDKGKEEGEGKGEGGTANPTIKARIGTPQGAIKLGIIGDNYQVPILRKVLTGEEGLIRCVSELVLRKARGRRKTGKGGGSGPGKGWEILLDIHIGRPVDQKARDLPHIAGPDQMFVPIGVDMGVRNILVAVAPGKGGKGVLFVRGGRWREKRRRFSKAKTLRKVLKDEEGWSASRWKEGYYVRDMVHQASRDLLDMVERVTDVQKGELPVIVLENLDFDGPAVKASPFRREQAEELDAWPRTLLGDIIIEKAAWEGIPVMVMAPDGTSVTCPRCGSPDAVRRRDVHRLVCPDCMYKADDDYCAAFNIARRGLARLMKDREAAHGRSSGGPRGPRYHDHHDNGLRGVTRPAEGGAANAPMGPCGEGRGGAAVA